MCTKFACIKLKLFIIFLVNKLSNPSNEGKSSTKTKLVEIDSNCNTVIEFDCSKLESKFARIRDRQLMRQSKALRSKLLLANKESKMDRNDQSALIALRFWKSAQIRSNRI